MFGIGLAELFVVMIVAVLVIGPAQLPETAAALGRMVRNVKRLYYEVKRDVYDHPFQSEQYQPKQKSNLSYPLPEGTAVPDLMDDEPEFESELEKEQLLSEKKGKKATAKKKVAKAKKKVVKSSKPKAKKQVEESDQIYLLPDDGPFGKGTDMEYETDLFSHAKKGDDQ